MYYEFIWTDEIIDHLAEHDVSPDDFEEVVSEPDRIGYQVVVRTPAGLAIDTASGENCEWLH